MSGLGTCRDCGQWIYWGVVERADGSQANVPYSDSAQTRWHWDDCAVDPKRLVTDVLGNSYKVEKCKTCQHSVYWETTSKGKKRQMDVFCDEDDGTYTAAGTCHFETCTGQRSGSNFRNGDSYSGSQRKQQTAEEPASKKREEIHDWEQKRLEPWLRDLKLTWPVTQVDITTAFRKLALETHPDMGGSDQAFIAVKRAYDQLRKMVNA